MAYDAKTFDRLTQRFEREGNSLFIRTLDGADTVNEFEFTNSTPGTVDSGTSLVAQRLLTDAAIGPVGGAAPGVRTVLFGHSYMAQETGGDADRDNFESFQVLGTVVVANALMGNPMRIVKAVAKGGRRILDLLPLYRKQVAPLRPRFVFVNIGHNDIKGLYSGFTDQLAAGPDERQRNLQYLQSRMREWLRRDVDPGTTVVLMGETPPGKDPSGTISTSSQTNLAVRFQKWNQIMENFASSLGVQNVMYVPLDRATVDPASPYMRNKDGAYYDAVHPGVLNTFERAKLLVTYLERLLPKGSDGLPTWADSYTVAKLPLTERPVFDGSGSLNVVFENAMIQSNYRKIEIGEWVTLMIPHSTNSTKGGRYMVTAVSDTGCTLAVPKDLVGTVTVDGNFISNSTQLFVNPLFLTATGGQAAASAVLGTVTGNLPAGVDINNLPATHTVAVTNVNHTLPDGSPGFGKSLKMVVTVTGSAIASTFDVRFRAAATSAVNAAYDNDRKVNVGQTLRMGLEVKQEGVTGGFQGFSIEMQGNITDPPGSGNSVTYKGNAFYRDLAKAPLSALHPWPSANMVCTLMTPEVTYERDSAKADRIVTNLDGRVYVNFFGNGTVTLYLSRLGMFVVDEPVEEWAINTHAGV